MELNELGISGRWLVSNCGKLPSEKNCKLVMMAPENQREDLLDASVAHAIKSHAHKDSNELREELDKLLTFVEV